MKKLIYLFLTVAFMSCSSDDSGNNSNSLEPFFRVTVDGQTHESSYPWLNSWGLNVDDCNGESAFEQGFPEIDTATRFYFGDISHYYVTSDFNSTSVGSYPITAGYLDGGECNLTLGIGIDIISSGESYSDLINGTHNVTSINQISSSSNQTEWSVEGNFSCTFSNPEIVSLTGSYRAVLTTYQD